MPRGHYGTKRSTPTAPESGWQPVIVGISLFHTVGDRDRAVEETNTAIVTIVSEVLTRMGVNPKTLTVDWGAWMRDPTGTAARIHAAYAKMEKSPLYPMWQSMIRPLYEEWRAFYADQSSWEEWLTSWETYEHWQDRVKELRSAVDAELARTGAGPLRSQSPGDLPKTLPGTILDTSGDVIKRVGQGAAGAVSDTWSMIKIGIYGALGIAGVIAVSSIVQQLRKDRDPLESYATLARGGIPRATALRGRG